MKYTLLSCLACAVTLSIPASAQIGIYIGVPPPPLRYEVPGPMPGPGYSWVEGFWQPYNGHYRWMRGQWQQPPYQGAYWDHPHYDHYRQGWQLHEGHWDHEYHGNGHDNGRGNGYQNNGHGNEGRGNQGGGNQGGGNQDHGNQGHGNNGHGNGHDN